MLLDAVSRGRDPSFLSKFPVVARDSDGLTELGWGNLVKRFAGYIVIYSRFTSQQGHSGIALSRLCKLFDHSLEANLKTPLHICDTTIFLFLFFGFQLKAVICRFFLKTLLSLHFYIENRRFSMQSLIGVWFGWERYFWKRLLMIDFGKKISIAFIFELLYTVEIKA